MKRQILRHLPALVGVGTLLASATICTSANAQWLPDRDHKSGPGIRLGERLELHPGIAVRAGYDNNVFRASSDLSASGMLAITPHINLSTISGDRLEGEGEAAQARAEPKFKLNSGASVSYVYYFQDAPPQGVEVDVNGTLSILPGRPVHGSLSVGYQREIRPFTQPGAGGAPNYTRDNVSPGATLGFSSRGGIFNASVGYRPDVIIQEKSSSGNDFSYLNVWRSQIPVNISWKFFPHTALLHETQIGYQKYLDPDGSNVALSDGTTLRTRLGINGALTRSISLQGMAGFATVFWDSAILDEYQEPLGEVRLTYHFLSDNKFKVGYSHDVSPSFTGGQQIFDKGTVSLDMIIARAFSLSADASVGQYTFGRIVAPDGSDLGEGGTSQRQDVRVDFGLHGEYRVTDYLAFMADFTGQVVKTDFEYSSTLMGTTFVDPAQFTYIQVFGGVRAFY